MRYWNLPEEEHEAYSLSVVAKDVAEEVEKGRGYVLLEDMFDPAGPLEVVERFVSDHVRRGGKTVSGGHRPGEILLAPAVQSLMVHPLLLAIGEILIRSRPAFGSLGSNSVPPGSDGMGIHIDYPYFAMGDLPGYGSPALCVQMIWYLVDVDERTAPTLVVPRTQIVPGRPSDYPAEVAEPVLAKAGSVFVGHGALWHGVGPNLSGRTRHAVLGSYVPFWVHPMLTPARFRSWHPGMDELLRSDFGHRIGEGYSATVADRREERDRPAARQDVQESIWAHARRAGRELDEATEEKIRRLEADE